ncbi:MAG: helix-hairpin-helix domain-containing protein [Anaerolineae bacterium]
MTIVIGLALVVLGLVVGFIVAWAFGAGATLNLFIGLLLVIAGGIVGFVTEWLIDEAYRKNRELRRQLGQQGGAAVALGAGVGVQSGDSSSETLAEFLRQRDEEVRDLREQLSAMDTQLDGLSDEFEAYQRTHPDDLTAIKGVGPVYQWKLRDAGVNTYQQLATADPDQLRRMLDIKAWQRTNVESWIEQARDWAQRKP